VDHCAQLPAHLCENQTALMKGASEFIWAENSPIQGNGGFWQNEAIYKDMVKDMMTQPRYLFPFIYRSFFDGFHQLFLNRIMLGELHTEMYTFEQIEKHFTADATAARQ